MLVTTSNQILQKQFFEVFKYLYKIQNYYNIIRIAIPTGKNE